MRIKIISALILATFLPSCALIRIRSGPVIVSDTFFISKETSAEFDGKRSEYNDYFLGYDNRVIIKISSDNIFTFENLSLIKNLTRVFEGMKGIRRIESITNKKKYKRTGGALSISSIIPEEIPKSSKGLMKLRSSIMARPGVAGVLIDDKAAESAIILEPDRKTADKNEAFDNLLDRVNHEIKRINTLGKKHPKIAMEKTTILKAEKIYNVIFILEDSSGTQEFAGDIINYKNLKIIDDLLTGLREKFNNITRIASVLDPLKEINMTFNSDSRAYYRIPEKMIDIADYFELMNSDDVDMFLAPMQSHGAVRCIIETREGGADINAQLEFISGFLEKRFDKKFYIYE